MRATPESRIHNSGYCMTLYVFSFWINPIQTIHCLFVPLQKSALDFHRQTSITHIVKTIPPLNINRANRGTAPDQNVKMPSSLKILTAQEKLFLYSLLASIDCILHKIRTLALNRISVKLPCLDGVQRLSNVSVYSQSCSQIAKRHTYTVINPANPPIPKVLTAPSFSPGAT